MNRVDPNPYAPPSLVPETDAPTSFPAMLRSGGGIRFSGAVEERDLQEFLRADGHVGCAFLMLLGLCIGLVSMVLLAQGRGLAAIAIGIMGVFVILSIVSTLSYRRRVFENANPTWQETRGGQLQEDGVHLDHGDVRVFFRWDWYWNAFGGDHWVALLPATQPLQPLFVTSSMLRELGDWQRVRDVAAAIAVDPEDSLERHRRRKILDLMRTTGRPRSIPVPSSAIAFAGNVHVRDFSRLPSRYRRREKPVRSYVVVTALFLSGSLIVAGLSNVIFQQFALLPIFLAIYAVLAAIGIAVRSKRRGKFNDSIVYFVNAYATETSVVTDFAVTTSEAAWPAMQLVVQNDEFIALRRQPGHFLLVRADMFSDAQQWQRFCDWASQKSASK